MEPYLYIGIMKRIIKNRDREFNEDLGHVEQKGNHDFFKYLHKEESSGSLSNLSLGFRVGYCF
ncbi:MAG: hypothetical protein EOO46_22610 [Flavobacterium sp.]|nr:MAG: hypothetical protein EOO46_22610 [Flavobacterium sp.]